VPGHAFGASTGSDADLLILFSPAATQRFEYFCLADKVTKGQATIEEILESEERFDNHFLPATSGRPRDRARGTGR
jgi:hypothetical protein